MKYVMNSTIGTFIYDDKARTMPEAIYVLNTNHAVKKALRVMMRTPGFVDDQGNDRFLPKDREIFFREFIPRTFKLRDIKVEKMAEDKIPEIVINDDTNIFRDEYEYEKKMFENALKEDLSPRERKDIEERRHERLNELKSYIKPEKGRRTEEARRII